MEVIVFEDEKKAAASKLDEVLCSLPPNVGSVFRVADSPDGKRIGSVSGDKKVYLHDSSTGARIRRFAGHTRSCTSLAFNNSSDILATASLNGEIIVWPIDDEADILNVCQVVESIDFCSDMNLVAGAVGPLVVMWDINSGVRYGFCPTRNKEETVSFIKFTPTGLLMGITNRYYSRKETLAETSKTNSDEESDLGVIQSSLVQTRTPTYYIPNFNPSLPDEPDLSYADDDDDDIQVVEAVIKTRPNAFGEVNVRDEKGWVIIRPPPTEPSSPGEPSPHLDDLLSQITTTTLPPAELSSVLDDSSPELKRKRKKECLTKYIKSKRNRIVTNKRHFELTSIRKIKKTVNLDLSFISGEAAFYHMRRLSSIFFSIERRLEQIYISCPMPESLIFPYFHPPVIPQTNRLEGLIDFMSYECPIYLVWIYLHRRIPRVLRRINRFVQAIETRYDARDQNLCIKSDLERLMSTEYQASMICLRRLEINFEETPMENISEQIFDHRELNHQIPEVNSTRFEQSEMLYPNSLCQMHYQSWGDVPVETMPDTVHVCPVEAMPDTVHVCPLKQCLIQYMYAPLKQCLIQYMYAPLKQCLIQYMYAPLKQCLIQYMYAPLKQCLIQYMYGPLKQCLIQYMYAPLKQCLIQYMYAR
ncbi:hypothetical protein TNCT_11181 [Trichonephila clavata]|uniref:Uncharacterized protein n=1 Tax=Trichonephila clavata TaxID=2740835 RepID=A0A8X6HH63_TRICU|nr:hypothetical protein TNCT_11181 [Trichonephila clavata]